VNHAPAKRDELDTRNDIVIQFTRTGGFAGRIIRGTIRADRWPDRERQQVETLLKSTGLFEPGATDMMTDNAPVADDFGYELVITFGATKRVVKGVLERSPPNIKRLFEFINNRITSGQFLRQ
jgi:hypothetical protein